MCSRGRDYQGLKVMERHKGFFGGGSGVECRGLQISQYYGG